MRQRRQAQQTSPIGSGIEASAVSGIEASNPSGLLGADHVLAAAEADVGRVRERRRQRRLARLAALLADRGVDDVVVLGCGADAALPGPSRVFPPGTAPAEIAGWLSGQVSG